MKYLIAAAAAALVAAPVLAQETAAAPTAAFAADVDPQRLALARTAAQALFPPGTFQRYMSGSMQEMTDQMMAVMLDTPVEDLLPEGADGESEGQSGARTFREVMAAEDPHFEERMRIMNRVMASEMQPIMTRLEPEMREALARSYARKFTAAQLGEITRFFATPSGAAFAAESVTIWMDPEIMSAMGKMTPELLKAMPAIMEKVQAATAHLPPPPSEEPKEETKKRAKRR